MSTIEKKYQSIRSLKDALAFYKEYQYTNDYKEKLRSGLKDKIEGYLGEKIKPEPSNIAHIDNQGTFQIEFSSSTNSKYYPTQFPVSLKLEGDDKGLVEYEFIP